MIKPIQFRKHNQVNLNLLKSQLDRRVDVITMMIKGIKMGKSGKLCSESCIDLRNTYCQTDEPYSVLTQVPILTLSNTPSMKSLKSPTNIKNSTSKKNKQNSDIVSSSFTSKNKKLLKSIQQSQQQALKTSRYNKNLQSNKKLQSEKKPLKKTSIYNQSNKKKIHDFSNVRNSFNTSSKRSYLNEKQENASERNQVLNSFQSGKKEDFVGRKSFGNYFQEYASDQKFHNLSFNSSLPDHSESKTKTKRRKDSMNDSFLNSSNNVNKNDKKPNQSLSTNTYSSTFIIDGTNSQYNPTGLKRIAITEDIRHKIRTQFQKRLQVINKKTGKQPRTNNVRVSLLKRLEDKYEKTQNVTK